MKIVGICRFSLLGRGDWKVYQGKPDSEVEAIAAEQARKLFAPERMEQRLAAFEHLTLASLKAQTDQDFSFVVLASELMPKTYRDRLIQLCAAVPQVTLRFFGLIPAGGAQTRAFSELGIALEDTLQFRLDDDDALCADFIRKKRVAVERLVPSPFPFAVSFRTVMFCSRGGNHAGIYHWDAPFLGVGVALHHPTKSIFAFGHFAMARRFTSIIIPGGMALVTHSGLNDTQFDAARIQRQKMVSMVADDARKACATHFPFLTETAKAMIGLPVAI